MKPQEKLVIFMERKAEAIMKLTGLNVYFTEEDRKDILGWEDTTSEFVWKKIVDNIDKGAYGLSPDVCPFCIYNDTFLKGCSTCDYGYRHGQCSADDSDYFEIMRALEAAETDVEVVFSNEWYQEVIDEIEGEEEE